MDRQPLGNKAHVLTGLTSPTLASELGLRSFDDLEMSRVIRTPLSLRLAIHQIYEPFAMILIQYYYLPAYHMMATGAHPLDLGIHGRFLLSADVIKVTITTPSTILEDRGPRCTLLHKAIQSISTRHIREPFFLRLDVSVLCHLKRTQLGILDDTVRWVTTYETCASRR